MHKPATKRTDPILWGVCKEEAVKKLGKFSARAMQHAVLLYKERGGGYIGEKSAQNPLMKWNEKEKKRTKQYNDSYGTPI